MESKARLPGGHPMHPALVALPLSLLPMMLILDALYWWFGTEGLWVAGFWVGVVGIVTTVAAIIPGAIDMSTIPDESRAHKTALFHAVVGTTILVVYAASVWLRWPVGGGVERFGLVASIDAIGTLLIVVQGYLGAELVYKHHIGVLAHDEGADPVALERKGDNVRRARGARGGPQRP